MKNEKGFSLVEVLVALALLGIIAVAFLGALATASKAIFVADEQATAESLARTEMEYIKDCNYEDLPTAMPWSYEIPDGYPEWDENHTLPEGYDGYSLTVEGNIFDADVDGVIEFPGDDDGIQRITVTVSHGDEVIILEGYKVDR